MTGVQTCALPISEAVQITREVADGLACAHRRLVVHRDIKPENILLVEGHAVLVDFGVAQPVHDHDAEPAGDVAWPVGDYNSSTVDANTLYLRLVQTF